MDPLQPCPVTQADSLAALRAEIDALTPVIGSLRADDLHRPTRLPEWDVQVLTAHLVRGVDRIRAYLTETLPDAPELSWTTYFTTALGKTDPSDVSERAKAFAASINDRPVLDVWRRVGDEALRVGAIAPPERPIATPFGAIRIDHYLPSRVLEVVVHGLDLRDALDLEPIATPPGLDVTCRLLDAMLDGPRPDDLDDPVAFALAATGRTPSDDERLPLLR